LTITNPTFLTGEPITEIASVANAGRLVGHGAGEAGVRDSRVDAALLALFALLAIAKVASKAMNSVATHASRGIVKEVLGITRVANIVRALIVGDRLSAVLLLGVYEGALSAPRVPVHLANPVFGAILARADTHAGLSIECGGIALAKDSGTKVEVVSSVLASKSGRNMLGAARIIVMRVYAVGASGDDMATSGSRIWSPWSVTTDSIAAVACIARA